MFIKTHAILDAFCEMNIEQLENLLNDDRIYDEVKKATFLKKLRTVFNKLGSEGENRLVLHGGECGECSIGCRGYIFKSSISGKNISFIFEETTDGEDFQDFYHCPSFKPNDAIVDTNNIIHLFFGSDEKANFRPSKVYLQKMEQCKSAIAEMNIEGTDEIVISKVNLIQWLEKYKKTRVGFELPPFFYETFNIFYDLYDDIERANQYLIYEDEALEAISEINVNGDNDDD